MGKHTAGPWKSEGKRLITTMAIIISSDDSLGPIAAVTEINAPIILAAPEMLEALKTVADSQGWDGNDPGEERWTQMYQAIRALLARIEGGE